MIATNHVRIDMIHLSTGTTPKGSTALTVHRTTGDGANLIGGRPAWLFPTVREPKWATPVARHYVLMLGCGLHNLHYYSCTPLLLSPPQEHGAMPLTGAAASRLEPILPMSFPDWFNFRVCLILQKVTVRTTGLEDTLPQHCKSTSVLGSVEASYHRRCPDIFRCIDALQHYPASNSNSSRC